MYIVSYKWKLIPQRGLAFIGVLLISTDYRQQATPYVCVCVCVCVSMCVCVYKIKELTVLSQPYSYVTVNRGTVINNK
jgi:hypothetical protein